MPTKTAFLYPIFFFFHNFLPAQAYKDATPLHSFFKNNFDSTIIYDKWSSWYSFPRYYIIAKKDSFVYFFTYRSEYAKVQGQSYPAGLQNKFSKDEGKFRATIPDTNNYFVPYNILYSKKIPYWSQINGFKLWSFDGYKDIVGECGVYDGGYDTYFLITNQGIKTKTFYSAEDLISCNPGNIQLTNEIKIRNLILGMFGD